MSLHAFLQVSIGFLFNCPLGVLLMRFKYALSVALISFLLVSASGMANEPAQMRPSPELMDEYRVARDQWLSCTARASRSIRETDASKTIPEIIAHTMGQCSRETENYRNVGRAFYASAGADGEASITLNIARLWVSMELVLKAARGY